MAARELGVAFGRGSRRRPAEVVVFAVPVVAMQAVFTAAAPHMCSGALAGWT